MRANILRALALLLALPAFAAAQAIPSPTAPKRAAQNAANRASAAVQQRQNTETQAAPPQTKTAQPQTKSAPPQTKSAPPTKSPQAAVRSPQSTAVAPAPRPQPILYREIFDYQSQGRRDPFVSLLSSSELRPTVSDLRLVAVAFDATGRNSVAIMRDLKTKEQYRVKVGQTLGRMRVAQIQPKAVVFSIEEFGYNRQEILAMGDTTRARTP